MVGNQRHGWAVFAAMTILFLAGFFVAYYFEAQGNPNFNQHGITQAAVEQNGIEQSGGNMEGKEVRFGIANSALFATVTTDASCGAVNSMHDSYTPLGGMIPLLNIMLGEVIFGGVGAGLYGMLVMVVLTVFIAGLMVGRTPEYLGKKIEAKEVKMAMLYALVFALSILVFRPGRASRLSRIEDSTTPGRMAYRKSFTLTLPQRETTARRSPASRSIHTGTTRRLGLAMLIGRFLMIIPMMAIAGQSCGQENQSRQSAGTFPVHTPLFVSLLIGVIMIVGALTFFPVLSLGPDSRAFLMNAEQCFKSGQD